MHVKTQKIKKKSFSNNVIYLFIYFPSLKGKSPFVVVTRHLPKEEFTHRQERGKLVQNQLQLSGNTCWDFSLLPMLTNRHMVGTTPVKFHNESSIPHTLFEVHAPKTVKKLLAWRRKRVGEVVWVIWLAKNVFSPTTTATSNVWTPGFVESVRWFWLEAGPWAPPLNSASGFWASVWLIDSWISCLLIQLVWNKSSLFLFFSFDFFFIFDLILWLPKFLSPYYVLSLSNWCDMIWTVQPKSKVIFYPHFK